MIDSQTLGRKAGGLSFQGLRIDAARAPAMRRRAQTGKPADHPRIRTSPDAPASCVRW